MTAHIDPLHTRKKILRTSALILGVAALLYGAYLIFLFRQLESAFLKNEEFSPTRIYSDVTRISPNQTRSWILSRLESLGYKTLSIQRDEHTISFSLRSINYPDYLIPEDHPTLRAQNQTVKLRFPSEDTQAPLEAIEVRSEEIPEIYLEPELVATLSRSGSADKKNEIRNLLKFEDVPAPIWKAIMAIEDQHFLDHKGLDPRGIARALWVNLKTLSLAQGGSTLTQQLVKNLMERKGKNIFRKVSEIFLSILLEARFDKEQILARYLNEVYLGQSGNMEIHGVSEGARYFFGKDVNRLNLAETAMMAGLIRGPAYYSPYKHWDRAMARQRLVLQKMVETGHIAEAEAKAALGLPIRLAPPQTILNKAPHFTDYVKAELIHTLKNRMTEDEIPDAGLRVFTTLDVAMNRMAQKVLSEGVDQVEKAVTPPPPKKTKAPLSKQTPLPPPLRLEGALAAVDQSTGAIRVLIGSRNYEQSTFNRILNMKRQGGSTFKPILYLAAILKGYDAKGIAYGSGYPTYDGPWTLRFDQGRQEWSPRNYEKEYRGHIPLRTALAHSINTVAAQVGADVGPQAIVNAAHELGIQSDLPAVPSLALGSAEVSPVELLTAYATLANRGIRDDLTVIRGITLENGTNLARFVLNPRQVMEQGPTDLITYMLQDVFTQGTARSALQMGFDRPAAGKTGTTNDYRDSWFVGYTPHLTATVWVGVDQGATPAKVKLTGSTAALPIWVGFMKRALEGYLPSHFPESENLKTIKIDHHSGKEATLGCPDAQVSVEKYVHDRVPHESGCESQPITPETERDQ